ncbi:MAG TPA: hypothetical protein VGJ57_05230 [Nitrospirales bacterium]
MHIAKAFMTFAVLLSFSAVTNAASGLPGDTSSGISDQSATGGQSGDQQQLEKQRRDQGIGTSGDLPMQDKGMRPENPPADPSKSGRVKDEQIMLGSAIPVVKGEVLRIDGDKFTVKDQAGTEVSLIVNQNTRMDCGQGGSLSSFQPRDQTATDRPLGQGDQSQGRGEQKGQDGKLQDLSRTNEQPGSEVGQATGAGKTASSNSKAACAFKPGDKIEAEVSDMGAATMIKTVSDKSKGSDDKGMGGSSQ